MFAPNGVMVSLTIFSAFSSLSLTLMIQPSQFPTHPVDAEIKNLEI